jgi:hypothetical protein
LLRFGRLSTSKQFNEDTHTRAAAPWEDRGVVESVKQEGVTVVVVRA